MSTVRTSTFAGLDPWASGGVNPVPGSPTTGVTYLTTLSNALMDAAAQYGTTANSAVLNQLFQTITQYCIELESNGILQWLAGTTYAMGAVAKGSDNKIYQSTTGANVGHDPTTAGASYWVSFGEDLAGKPIQSVFARVATVATTTANLSMAGGVPTWGSGYQALAGTITPTAAGNKILVQVELCMGTSYDGLRAAALFVNGTGNAVAGTVTQETHNVGGNDLKTLCFTHEYTATSTAPVTFNVVMGDATGDSNATYLNSVDGATALLGGLVASTITMTEIRG